MAVPLPAEGLVDQLAGPGVPLDRAPDELDRLLRRMDRCGAVFDCAEAISQTARGVGRGRRSGSGRLPGTQPYMQGS